MTVTVNDSAIVITGDNAIRRYQLLAMRSALKLEIIGLRFKGKQSVSARIKRQYNLPRTMKKALVLEFLNNKLAEVANDGKV